MKDCRQFYIDGKWVNPVQVHDLAVVNPANEEAIATISLGSAADVDRAVATAKRAFDSYSDTSLNERLGLLRRIIDVYQSKMDEMADTISQEMGAPSSLARKAPAPAGLAHLMETVTWERTASCRRPAFSSHLIASTIEAGCWTGWSPSRLDQSMMQVI